MMSRCWVLVAAPHVAEHDETSYQGVVVQLTADGAKQMWMLRPLLKGSHAYQQGRLCGGCTGHCARHGLRDSHSAADCSPQGTWGLCG